MKIVDGSNNEVTLSTVLGNTTDVTPDQNKVLTYTGVPLYKKYTLSGQAFEGTEAVALIPGRNYAKTQISALFPTATVTSVTPATGLHTGTVAGVVMKGQNLGGVTAISINSVAATAVTVVSDSQVTFTAPAQSAAGTYNIVITDDSGTVTVTNGWVST